MKRIIHRSQRLPVPLASTTSEDSMNSYVKCVIVVVLGVLAGCTRDSGVDPGLVAPRGVIIEVGDDGMMLVRRTDLTNGNQKFVRVAVRGMKRKEGDWMTREELLAKFGVTDFSDGSRLFLLVDGEVVHRGDQGVGVADAVVHSIHLLFRPTDDRRVMGGWSSLRLP